jgi:hypothetical protein
MKLHLEDVKGFEFDQEIICLGCATPEEKKRPGKHIIFLKMT